MEAGYRPVRPKQVCTSRKVQDGHKHVDKGHSNERCVGRIIGLEGRVPSCTSTSSVKEVSEIRLSRQSVPVQNPSIRPIHISQSLYSINESSRLVIATARATTVTVPRRLAHTERRSSFSTFPSISVLAGSDSTQPHPQQGKVRLNPGQSIHLHGDGIPYEEVHSPSTTEERINRLRSAVQTVKDSQSITARQFLSILGSINAAADLVSYGRLHLGQSVRSYTDYPYYQGTPQLVDNFGTFIRRDPDHKTGPIFSPVHGRQSFGVGSTFGA